MLRQSGVRLGHDCPDAMFAERCASVNAKHSVWLQRAMARMRPATAATGTLRKEVLETQRLHPFHFELLYTSRLVSQMFCAVVSLGDSQVNQNGRTKQTKQLSPPNACTDRHSMCREPSTARIRNVTLSLFSSFSSHLSLSLIFLSSRLSLLIYLSSHLSLFSSFASHLSLFSSFSLLVFLFSSRLSLLIYLSSHHLSLFSSSISLLVFLFSLSLFSSISLLNDNDSDHWFSKLSLCPWCQSARAFGPLVFGEKLARYICLGIPARNPCHLK